MTLEELGKKIEAAKASVAEIVREAAGDVTIDLAIAVNLREVHDELDDIAIRLIARGGE